jgi:hypothetical protein
MPPANSALYSRLEDKTSASEIANEIARKQSSTSMFDNDAMSTPEAMITSPSSAGGDLDGEFKMFEKLRSAAKD